jgi:hypothetical protein
VRLDDREAFALLMTGLSETYNEPVSVARMEIYFSALVDVSIDDVRRAAYAHVSSSKFFPKPAEIREWIAGNVEDRAEVAWNVVVNLVRRVGYPGVDGRGKAPDFPDEATRRAALELFGGWVALCEQLPGAGSPSFIGTAKQFRALYGAYARRDAALPPGETGRELSAGDARAALSELKANLQKRGLPTGAL